MLTLTVSCGCPTKTEPVAEPVAEQALCVQCEKIQRSISNALDYKIYSKGGAFESIHTSTTMFVHRINATLQTITCPITIPMSALPVYERNH